MKQLPNEDVIYLADTARIPFGGRAPQDILRINLEIMNFMVESGVKLVMMACGTSSSIAYPILFDRYQIPIIGLVEPAAEEAVNASRNGKIGLIATEGSVGAGFFQGAIKEKNQRALVIAVGCPLFVPQIEKGDLESEETERMARVYLKPIQEKGADTLIFGCTHYPHLRGIIGKIMGPDVSYVDPGEGMARQAKEILLKEKLLRTQNPKPRYQYCATGPWRSFQEVGSNLLGKTIPNVRQITLRKIM